MVKTRNLAQISEFISLLQWPKLKYQNKIMTFIYWTMFQWVRLISNIGFGD